MKKFIFYVLCFFVSVQLHSQNKYSKTFDRIKTSYDQNKLTSLVSEFSQRQIRLKNEAETYARINNIPMRYEKEDGTLLELQYITEDGIPIYYTTFNVDAAISTRTNFLNSDGGLGLALNGDDLIAHVWDGGLARGTHQEYDGSGGDNRFSIGDASTTLNFHAAHVTGTIMASGFVADAKGMAWQADAVGYDWNNDESEAAAAAAAGMLLSNHSYGYRLRDDDGQVLLPPVYLGGYINVSRNWDNIMYNAPYYLMVVAAGNDGNDDSANSDPLDGTSAFDKLSGHATSKNNLVIANANDAIVNVDGTLQSVFKNSSSSEGPTDDYRIKPDITGNGTGLYSSYESADDSYNSITGTSMASPNVTGSLLLLQEHYFNLYGTFMLASTLKGLALHTADDAGDTGPDANFGWGLLNTKKAAETLTSAAATSGSTIVKELTLNQGDNYQITVQSNGVDPLLASISWTDIGGTVQAVVNDNTPRLVNDLDVRLNNGTAYTPWKLTSADSNGKGDNTVDPYERIDIDGASGFYTLTVSHKGSLNTGSQNFSLIVSGIIVATTPVISYSTTSSNLIENTDCAATLVTFPLNIAQAPSANATVDFTVNESSTAINGLDFSIVTPSIVFLSGVNNSINLELNIYNDGFIESDETIIIDFNVVNDTGGDASANLNGNKLTLTLTDDDIVPTENKTVSIYSEDMEEAPYGFTTNLYENGSSAWEVNNASVVSSYYWTTTGNSTNFAYTNDDACNCDKSNDLLTTEEFSLDGHYSSATLTFDHAFSNESPEIGDVLVSTGGEFISVLTLSNTSAGNSIKTTPWVNDITVDMTPYIGEAVVQVQFRYNDGNAWSYGMAVDNISITGVTPTLVQTAVNEGLSSNTQILSTSGTIYTSDSLTGDVMLDITNDFQDDDFGCIEVSVSRSGTGAQSYNGSNSTDLVMDKTFEISSSNIIESGSTSISFYFTEEEISGWESATSNMRGDLVIYRVIDGVITEISLATIGSFADNVMLSGDFSDIKGTYVFGNAFLQEPIITFNNIDSSYGDDDFNLEAMSNSPAIISYTIVGENSTGTSLSGANNETVNVGNVGAVIIRATQEADNSFSSATHDITLTIQEAPLTITATSGLSKVFGEIDPILTYSITGFVNGETEADLDIGVNISRDEGENVGNYTITPSEAGDSNYALSFVTSTFTITPFLESRTVTWSGATNNDWDTSSNWSDGVTPTSLDDVIIPGDLTNYPTSSTSVSVNSATMASGSSLIAQSSFSGNITYNRLLSTGNWYLISSPVSGETYDDTYVTDNGIDSWTELNRAIAFHATSNNTWYYMQAGANAATFLDGIGYAVKRSSAGDISFTGTMNTDDAGVDIVLSNIGKRFNLLGNPYTSHIASATFLNDELAISETKTIWVWNQALGASGAYDVKIIADAFLIAPAQGFFVRANAAGGTFNFAKSNQASNGGTFQRTEARPEIYLTLSNHVDSRQARIYYIENMTTGFDVGYEGELFDGVSNSLAIYTELIANSEGEKYQVQSLPNNDFENMIIPVGINAESGTTITIDASKKNFPSGINIYLEDKQDNTFTLLDADANFSTTLENSLSGIGRFYLHTTSEALSADQLTLNNNISIYKSSNDKLRIVGVLNGTTNLQMFDVLGKVLLKTSFEGNGVNDIKLNYIPVGIYIVKLITVNGVINKKILIN
jgi:hypothetical protein